MSPELTAHINLEREGLRKLLGTFAPLVAQCLQDPPGTFDVAALATMLHSFYNGVETMLKRIIASCDGVLPEGVASHSQLLEVASAPTRSRLAVISGALAVQLREYMGFRHVFRHAYTYDLQWDKMRPLVGEIERVFDELERQLDAFLASRQGA